MSPKRAFLNLAIAALAWPMAAQAQVPESWSAWSGPPGGLGIKQSRLQFTLQLEEMNDPSPWRWSPAGRGQGLSLSLVGRSSLAPTLAVYGRVSTLPPRPEPLPVASHEGYGLSYAAGLSWDFSRRASATVGVEGYDLRLGGAREPVLATSLGLRWRY